MEVLRDKKIGWFYLTSSKASINGFYLVSTVLSSLQHNCCTTCLWEAEEHDVEDDASDVEGDQGDQDLQVEWDRSQMAAASSFADP